MEAQRLSNSNSRPVVNEDLHRCLDTAVLCLNTLGVHVQFWHVPREQKWEADKLAKAALNGTRVHAVAVQLMEEAARAHGMGTEH
jgi:hypothetical protein